MRTYRLAVFEDDDLVQKEIGRLCDRILEEEGIAHTITCFSSAVALENVLRTGEPLFDLLILDIGMEEMTGMELALKLRSQKNRVSILFVSGYEEYLKEGYQVQPVQFLLKPLKPEELARALKTDWELNHSPKILLLQKGSRGLQLVLSEILYMETGLNHSTRIHQADTEYTFPISLTEMMKQLPSGTFTRCHNSYLVNLEHVRRMERTGFYLDDGSEVPIGRKYYKECQKAIIDYVNQ